MKMTRKLAALLGAGALVLSVAGVALAEDLKDNHVGVSVWWEDGVAMTDFDGINTDESCSGMELGYGEVFFHFVQSPTEADHGDITVDFGSDGIVGPQGEAQNGGAHLAWDVYVTDDGDGTVTVEGASTNVAGDGQEPKDLKISHICAGDGSDSSQPPSFDSSQEAETTQPATDALGGSNTTSGPADASWLLVVAMGVLLASAVVLTPARMRSRR
jgi:hypothetical protein